MNSLLRLFSVVVAGGAAYALIDIGTRSYMLVVLDEVGVEMQLDPANSNWTTVPWRLGSSAPEAALMIRLQSDNPSAGWRVASAPDVSGRVLLRSGVSAKALDEPVARQPWCFTWKPGDELTVGTTTFQLITNAARGEATRKKTPQQVPYVVSTAAANSLTYELRDVVFPNALRLDEQASIFVTRSSKSATAPVLIIQPPGSGNTVQPLRVGDRDITVPADMMIPAAGFVEARIWEPRSNNDTVYGRFIDSCRFAVSREGAQTVFRRLAVPREDTVRVPIAFFAEESTEHFLVSRWLYEHPGGGSLLTRPATGGTRVAEKVIFDFREEAMRREGLQVALTFDDGPSLEHTEAVLNELKAHHARATFFLVGQMILPPNAADRERAAQLMRRAVAEGHEIANHTWDHSYKWYLEAQADSQIERTNDAIRQVLGFHADGTPDPAFRSPRFFRPPGGTRDRQRPTARTLSHELNMILWSADPQEYRLGKTADQVAKVALAQLGDGGVLLMHDTKAITPEALKVILPALKQRNPNVEFLTLSEMQALGRGEPLVQPVQLPEAAAHHRVSYFTLPHLPGDWLGGELRVTLPKPHLLPETRVSGKTLEEGASLKELHLPGRASGTMLLRWRREDRDGSALGLVIVATLLAALCTLALGFARHGWLATLTTLFFSMSITRFVLCVGANRIYPEQETDLWQPHWEQWRTDGVPWVPLAALFLPSLVPMVVAVFGGAIGQKATQPNWVKWKWWIAAFPLLLVVIWVLPGGERFVGVQKSVAYFPLLCGYTAALVGIGGWQLYAAFHKTHAWVKLLLLFSLIAVVHGAGAMANGDLGAVLVLIPLGLLFVTYALSQPSSWWQIFLLVMLVALGWSIWCAGTTFLEAANLGRLQRWDFPWLARFVLAATTLGGAFAIVSNLRRRAARGLVIVAAFVAAGAWILLPSLAWTHSFLQQAVLDQSGQMREEAYRKFLRLQSRKFLMEEGTTKAMEIFEEQELVRIHRQSGLWGDGYVQQQDGQPSPPIPRKRNNNVLNDYVTSVFVQGQFGRCGVAALLMWTCALWLVGARLPSTWRDRPDLAFSIALGKAACWVWAFLTMTMTASNLGLIPLTGKNAVLLGLNSGSDVLEAVVLAILAAVGAHAARLSITPIRQSAR